MTERERIIDILNKNFTQEVECTPVYTTADGKEIALPQELCDIFNDIVTQAVIPYFADALIAAGIGDVKEAELERKAYEVTSNQYRIWFKEQKDRAEVAERALKNACEDVKETVSFLIELSERVDGLRVEGYLPEESEPKAYINRAEKELAEERKDE